MRLLFWIIVLGSLTNCSTKNHEKVIVIQPFGKFPEREALLVLEGIRKVNPNTVLKKNIPLPAAAFYKPRNRYRADSIISYLSKRTGKDTVVIGLTEKDISTTKGKVKDWGVMGLGFRPGSACVASTFRLSEKNKNAQFYKVAIHELGHTQGLPHCADTSCFMRDAEGGNPLDQEKDFCRSCKAYLKGKNWRLI